MDLQSLGPSEPSIHNVQCSGAENDFSECGISDIEQLVMCESAAGLVCQGLYRNDVQCIFCSKVYTFNVF